MRFALTRRWLALITAGGQRGSGRLARYFGSDRVKLAASLVKSDYLGRKMSFADNFVSDGTGRSTATTGVDP